MSHRFALGIALVAVALALAGCGGSQSKANGEEDAKPADSATADEKPADKSEKADKEDSKSDKSSSKGKDEELNDAQREQMEIALRRGGDKAGNCDRVVPGTAIGEAEVKVTFDGKKGRAVDVQVGPPWAGTPGEQCIKRSFIGEIIVPFEGQLEVPYTVKIGTKADDKATKNAKGPKKK